MRRFFTVLVWILSWVMLWQLYQLFSQYRNLKGVLLDFNQKAVALEEENKNLQEDAAYFQNPQNLEKELRSRFNYKKQGEKLIIVVPPKDP